jgi:hypothetical protein
MKSYNDVSFELLAIKITRISLATMGSNFYMHELTTKIKWTYLFTCYEFHTVIRIS